jgi:hypothetical protein
LFSNTAVHADAAATTPIYKKHPWLPLLTVLFIFSYGLMTMLIVEQGSTIESQRALIRDLFHDSTELSAVKGKAVQEKNAADAKRRAHGQAPLANGNSNQPLANQAPSSQGATNQSASNQAAPAKRMAKKPQLVVPSRPASDLADDRRALITI